MKGRQVAGGHVRHRFIAVGSDTVIGAVAPGGWAGGSIRIGIQGRVPDDVARVVTVWLVVGKTIVVVIIPIGGKLDGEVRQVGRKVGVLPADVLGREDAA